MNDDVNSPNGITGNHSSYWFVLAFSCLSDHNDRLEPSTPMRYFLMLCEKVPTTVQTVDIENVSLQPWE